MQKTKTFINNWQTELFLAGAAIILFVVMLYKMPIFDGDTFYYIAKAKKMLATGDWLNTGSLMAKPVLGIWVMAITYKLLGVSLFTTYLWHSLFALGSLVVLYLFLNEFSSRKTAQIGTAVLLTSLMFFYQSCSPMLDMPMIFFLIITHWFLFKYIKYKKSKFLYLTALFCGLNFLTKGLMGAVLPAATFFFYLVFTKKNPFREYPRFIADIIISALVFLLIISIWIVPQIKTYGSSFTELLYRENIVRFFKPIDETGGYREVSSDVQRDPHVNIIYLFFSFLPWSPFIIPAILSMFKTNYFERKDFMLFSLAWFSFVLLITTISGHYKGPRYLLPLFAPLAIIIGTYFSFLIEEGKSLYKKLASRSYFLILLLFILGFLYILLTNFQHGENQYKPFVLSFMGLYCLVLFSGYHLIKKEKWLVAINSLVVLSLISYFLFLSQGNIYMKRILPSYQMSKYLEQRYPQHQIATWKIKIRSLNFYLGKRVEALSAKEELKILQKNDLVVVEKENQDELINFFSQTKEIYSYGNWILVQILAR